ncbi:MAG: DNA repair protein RecO C-terminal domain-containing protein [Thalassobaculum sp.]
MDDAGTRPGCWNDPLRLAGLSAVCAVADAALPEREPHPGLYEALGCAARCAWPTIHSAMPGSPSMCGGRLGLSDAISDTASTSRPAPQTGTRTTTWPIVSPADRAGPCRCAAGEPYRDKLLALAGLPGRRSGIATAAFGRPARGRAGSDRVFP